VERHAAPAAHGGGPAKPRAVVAAAVSVQPARDRRWRPGGGYRLAGVLIVVAALIAAGSLALAMSGHGTVARGGPGGGSRGAVASTRARVADWVAGQVGPAATVSCDPAMCRLLQAHGVPRADLYPLGPQTTSPLRATVVVATPAVRAQFGQLLSSVYAPAVMASFGAGPARIDIRQSAPHGTAAYWSAVRADLRSRKASGAELLSSNRITVSATARRQLESGRADSRLLITMAGLAAVHPVYIAAFGSVAPGASPGIPLRFAEVAPGGGHQAAGRTVTPAFARVMLAFLHAQHAPFRPDRAAIVDTAGGRQLLRIEFAAPSPLGLLGPHQ
jgi:hypothetical protein